MHGIGIAVLAITVAKEE